MNYRNFSDLGWKVSEIGLGCWQIGWCWGDVSDSEARSVLKEALDNFFNPSEESDTNTSTTSNNVSATTTPTSNVGGTANKSTSNVEDAFDQLFNS